MDKSQILALLKEAGHKITVTKLNQTITACDLDPHAADYDDDQAERILNAVTQKPQTHRNNQKQAKDLAAKSRTSLATGQQQRLVAMTEALDRAEQRREEVLEHLSDRIAYLQDDRIFMADLFSRAQQKLNSNGDGSDEGSLATEIDALTDAFNAIADWEYPAIAPMTIAGCLPM